MPVCNVSHLVLYLRNLRSLAAKPTSVVATLAFAMGFRWALRRNLCINPRNKGHWFVDLVPGAALASRCVFELLLPCASRNLVELFEEWLINWEAPPFLQFAQDVLDEDLIVSR